MLCAQCGIDVDGLGCNEAQAQECINKQPQTHLVGEVPDTDAFFHHDDELR